MFERLIIRHNLRTDDLVFVPFGQNGFKISSEKSRLLPPKCRLLPPKGCLLPPKCCLPSAEKPPPSTKMLPPSAKMLPPSAKSLPLWILPLRSRNCASLTYILPKRLNLEIISESCLQVKKVYEIFQNGFFGFMPPDRRVYRYSCGISASWQNLFFWNSASGHIGVY